MDIDKIYESAVMMKMIRDLIRRSDNHSVTFEIDFDSNSWFCSVMHQKQTIRYSGVTLETVIESTLQTLLKEQSKLQSPSGGQNYGITGSR